MASQQRSMGNLAIGAWRAGTLGLVAAVAAANAVWVAQKTPPPPLASPSGPADPVMLQEARFAALRVAVLGRGLSGVVGYKGDLPASQLLADARGVEDYYSAQFVLAPLVLDLEADRHDWMIVNLRNSFAGWKAPSGWRVEQDFGGGLRLLRKAAP